MFFLGLLSTPLPYIVLAVFYLFGFATGMFKATAENEPIVQVEIKNIQVESKKQSIDRSADTFHFSEYKSQGKDCNSAVISVPPPPDVPNEKLIYFVRELKIPHSYTSNYLFCRPPPTCG